MKIESFRFYKYALPLHRPIEVHGLKLNKREGLIIHLKSDRDAEGFGEVAPLEGWSEESLNDAQEQVRELKAALTGRDVLPGVEKLDGKMNSWFEELNLRRSVQFGIEMAVLNLIAATKNTPLFQSVAHEHSDHRDYTRVHALLDGTVAEVARQAKKYKDDGFMDMKLKVRGSVDESVEKVRAVNEVVHGEVLLHLDANQAWELEEAVRFGREIECSTIAYIEEPLKHVYHIPEFYQETMIPVALDESLLKLSVEEFKSMDGVDVLVLKPTALGGLEKTWQLMQQARALGLAIVISSSFESGLGILTLANLASCTVRDSAAGLDTLKWFAQDLLEENVLIRHGKVNIRQRPPCSEDINFELLKEIL